MLLIALALSLIASVMFGVLPALQLSRVSQLQALGRAAAAQRRRETRTRTALVVSQLVLATVLLVGAGLLVNSFMNLSRVEKGYDPANALAFQLVLPAEYATERKAATIESLLARSARSSGDRSTPASRIQASCSASRTRSARSCRPDGRYEEMRGGAGEAAFQVAQPRLPARRWACRCSPAAISTSAITRRRRSR